MNAAIGSALDAFAAAYSDRLAAARLLSGQGARVIGVTDNTVPVELILAAQARAVTITPNPDTATPLADQHIEPSVDPRIRAMIQMALSGDLQFLDLLIIGRSDEWLYYYLKEIVRLGDGALVPPLYLHDYIASPEAAYSAYGYQRISDLRDRLARLATDRFDMTGGITCVNSVRDMQRGILAARERGALSGVQALTVIGAARFLPPERYLGLGKQLLDGLEQVVRAIATKVMVVASAPIVDTGLHHIVESQGAVVIAENCWWGSQCAGDDVATGADPLEMINNRYLAAPSAHLEPRKAREAWLRRRLAKQDLDGVIFVVPLSDEVFGWDYPGLKAFTDELGIASLLVRDDIDPATIGNFVRSLNIHQQSGSAE